MYNREEEKSQGKQPALLIAHFLLARGEATRESLVSESSRTVGGVSKVGLGRTQREADI